MKSKLFFGDVLGGGWGCEKICETAAKWIWKKQLNEEKSEQSAILVVAIFLLGDRLLGVFSTWTTGVQFVKNVHAIFFSQRNRAHPPKTKCHYKNDVAPPLWDSEPMEFKFCEFFGQCELEIPPGRSGAGPDGGAAF